MSSSHARECPLCGGPALRTRRRFVDRLISVVIPVHRYQCRTVSCGWRGNLRVSEGSFADHASQKQQVPVAPKRRSDAVRLM